MPARTTLELLAVPQRLEGVGVGDRSQSCFGSAKLIFCQPPKTVLDHSVTRSLQHYSFEKMVSLKYRPSELLLIRLVCE